MGKIPVGKTISGAYGFAFGNFLSILGIVWFPVALMLVGVFLFVRPLIPIFQRLVLEGGELAATAESGAPMEALPPEFMELLTVMSFAPLLTMVSAILVSIIFVGLGEQALGLRRGVTLIYFSLAYPVWRLLIAMVCVYLIFFGVLFGGILVVGFVAGAATFAAGEVAAGLAAGIGMLVLFCAVLYGGFRLIFFMIPVTVAEGHDVITRSWYLSRGNFWRGVVVFIALAIPLLIVEWILLATVGATVLANIQIPLGEPTPEEAQAMITDLFASARSLAPIAIPVILLLTVLGYGLFVGASAVAYRALVPAREEPSAA